VVLGGADALAVAGARVERVHWIDGAPPEKPVRARVRIRYRDPGAPAWVHPEGATRARVVFDHGARAVCPGQAAVFDALDDDSVLGGGWIAGRVR
jgi:tRNA-specific 2-thiouridylase